MAKAQNGGRRTMKEEQMPLILGKKIVLASSISYWLTFPIRNFNIYFKFTTSIPSPSRHLRGVADNRYAREDLGR
jgi:hypothetical protein